MMSAPRDIAGYREACEIAEALLGLLIAQNPDWSKVRERAIRLAQIADQFETRKED